MSQPMKLQFSHQDYQTRAVDAVVKVFDGQPLAQSGFTLTRQLGSVTHAVDGSVGNALHLSVEHLLGNVQQVQAGNFLDAKVNLRRASKAPN